MEEEEIKKKFVEGIDLYHYSCKSPIDFEYNCFRCPDCHKFLNDNEITEWIWKN